MVFLGINLNKFRILKIVKVIIVILFILIIFYLSWLKNANFENISLIPKWLNDWSNMHGQLRTAIPFIPLGFLLNTYKKKWIISLTGLAISFLVVCIAEIGQFFIITRVTDMVDIFFGLVGSLFGMVLQNIFNKIETKV